MRQTEGLTTIEEKIANELGNLKPAIRSVTRDNLMFHAGQVAARRHIRILQGSTSVLAITVIFMGIQLGFDNSNLEKETRPEIITRIVDSSPDQPLLNHVTKHAGIVELNFSQDSLICLRSRMLTEGPDSPLPLSKPRGSRSTNPYFLDEQLKHFPGDWRENKSL